MNFMGIHLSLRTNLPVSRDPGLLQATGITTINHPLAPYSVAVRKYARAAGPSPGRSQAYAPKSLWEWPETALGNAQVPFYLIRLGAAP